MRLCALSSSHACPAAILLIAWHLGLERIWSHDWSIWDFVALGSGTQSHQVLVFAGRPGASSSGIPQQFATEDGCRSYLAACRSPDGFECPQCGNRSARELTGLRRWQCAGCRRQVSLTAGTVLHNTKLPLTIWFWAAYCPDRRHPGKNLFPDTAAFGD
jgi:hypothetical protein